MAEPGGNPPDGDPAVAEGWQGILDPGEQILWQGQPEARLGLRDIDYRRTLFGLAILLFALFWSFGAMAALANEGIIALLFFGVGMFFIIIGAREAFGYLVIAGIERANTWYTLTNRRAFIGTHILGKRALKSYPIHPDTVLEFVDGEPGSIWFARDFGRKRGGGRRQIGFDRIAEPRKVYDLMRQAQRSQS